MVNTSGIGPITYHGVASLRNRADYPDRQRILAIVHNGES